MFIVLLVRIDKEIMLNIKDSDPLHFYLLRGGIGSFRYGSTRKYTTIQNVKAVDFIQHASDNRFPELGSYFVKINK